MKRLNVLWMLLCLAALPILSACDNDDDGYSIGDFTPPLWATTHVVGNAFYLDCDQWGTLWPVNTNLGWYKAVEGERVITQFNPLSDKFQDYDHAVKLLTLQRVLTKKVEVLTDENEEEFGNNGITILKGDMGISGNHLNLFFLQNLPAAGGKHRISLVRPESDEDLMDAEGYICLELRYNTYDNITSYQAFGAVSYNLEELDIDQATGVKVKINSSVNGEVTVTFKNEDKESEGTFDRLKDANLSGMQLK